MTRVFRITLAFEPISSVDVLAEDSISAIKQVVLWLKENGNKIDDGIVLSCETISEINPLEKAEPSNVEDEFDLDEQKEEE